jgi:acyl-CoA synthetase (AMP-forming)/AMP-acid ligase II
MVSVGRALGGHSLRVVDRSGAPRREGHVGEIQVSGPSVTDGYWGEPDTGLLTGDGYLRTGDLGFILDGELFVSGRAKDIVIINGRNYALEQIERDALRVAECANIRRVVACYGHNSELQSEKLHLLMEYRSMPTAEARQQLEQGIRATLSERLDLPVRGIHWIAKGNIPFTTSGKVRRFECLRLVQQHCDGQNMHS